MGRLIDTEKEFSAEFQNYLLDIFELCYKNDTDSCTVTFEYPNAVMEVDFTFRAKRGQQMGMSIDDNVEFLNEAKKFYEDIANNPSLNETIKSYFTIESLESAINIMRKYQKIEEILDQLIDSKIRTYDAVTEIEDIVYGQAGDQNEES